MQNDLEAGSEAVQETEECRVSVACREGNWVPCNDLLHFLVYITVFFGASSETLKLSGDVTEGTSKQQNAKNLGFGVLESVGSPQFADIFLIPWLQTVLVVFRTPLHGTRPGLLHLAKPNSWSSYFVVFYDKWNAKFSIFAFSHGPLTHVVGLFREQDKPGCGPRVCSSFRCPSKG